jgi:hypothetical protein
MEWLEPRLLLEAGVVINEIHYAPDVKTEQAEFVELYNTTNARVDVGGWYFSEGIAYTFPVGASIPAHGYVVVAENPAFCKTKFGMAATPYGPFTGVLSNEGEKIVLRNASDGKEDQVDYGRGFPWPTVGDSPGYSIELINPSLDNDLGGNWRRSALDNTGALALIAGGSTWDYRKGTSEASSPATAWRQRTFVEDATWTPGAAAIGYGEAFLNTTLDDMQGGYTTVYLRQTFTVNTPSDFTSLRLEAQYADGFIAWINGTFVAKANVASAELPYTGTASSIHESASYSTFALPAPSGYLVSGTNVLAVQLVTFNKEASPASFFDARLLTDRHPGPTPGMVNSVFDANAAPAIRQVHATPEQPVAGEAVAITAKITDPNGVASVLLQYQVVDPGSYIAIEDAAYQTGWVSVAMNDAGTGGDAAAGDNVYTAVLPAAVQTNRRLVRYRITATDGLGLSVRGPYVDDPQPNFAYYVYNGVPAWSGAIQPTSGDPVKAQVVTYPASVMNSLPVYTLISKKDSVEDATWHSQYGGDLYLWSGTLVYDGVVYDGIHYRARGGVWRYAMGKNMWKFDFNTGHEFQARDNYGRPYETKWTKLNLGACIQQGDYGYRGEQGLFESVGFALFNLAGVEASRTNFATFRVVDDAAEAGATQYEGDFWGLYLAVEQVDGHFLDEHGLPDGNLYKMEYGVGGGELQNQGPDQPQPSINKDLVDFTNGYNSSPSDQWFRDNLELDRYYSYRAVIEAIHHYDVVGGKNYFYYHNPDTNRWHVMPWDLDLTWANTMYGDGNEPLRDKVLPRAAFSVDYKNRVREIRDLLYNTDQTYQLIDEMARLIYTSGQPSIVGADRAMWDYNPIMVSGYVNQGKAGQGRFYQIAATRDFPGMVQLMKNYVVSRSTWIDQNFVRDVDGTGKSYVPGKPTVTYAGPVNYPINQLQFHCSAFVKSANGTGNFAAMEWRIGEVTDPLGPIYDPAAPKSYEINALWESGELTTFTSDVVVPGNVTVPGHTYRVRARMKDTNGRWSNWSDAAQFVAGNPSGNPPDTVRVTEVMYHPGPPPFGSGYVKDDFEYIELKNIGAEAIDLTGARFTDAVTFTFLATTLQAGQTVLVVKDRPAFESRYGPGKNIAGQFAGALSDSSATIRLATSWGQTLQTFTYKDGWFPQTDGEGFSLVVRDPAQALALWDSKDGWRPSRLSGGSPGTDDVDYNPGSITINEVLAHQDTEPPGDWVELRNNTTSPIDVGGWYLSDDPTDLMKYRITATVGRPSTVIPPGEYLVLYESYDFGVAGNPGCITPFGFSELGDEVCLSSVVAPGGSLAGYREQQDFGPSEKEVPLIRYVKSTGGVDFVAESAKTPGEDNAGPLVGPVVINEIMYCPMPGGDEFIELKNVTGADVLLYDPARPADTWRFTSGITYAFPTGASVPAGGFALVVGGDPAAFRSKYGVPAAVPVYGPYAGLLSNTGGTVELAKPEIGGVDTPVPYYRADRVTYGVVAPWPTTPAGGGPSLQRSVATAYGNDVANWYAGPIEGTPGFENGSTDVTPPRLVDVYTSDGDPTHVTVLFSEALDPVSSQTPACYTITNVTVSDAAAGADNRTVILTTSTLSDGVAYPLTINHVKNAAGVEVQPDTRKVFNYSSTGTGLWGQYYQYPAGNINWAVCKVSRLDATVNFNWGTGSPDPLLLSDLFSARWTGKIKPTHSETYTFYTLTEDGVRLWVNGQLIIDHWSEHAAAEDSGTIGLEAGRKYDIKMEYYENLGTAQAVLMWSSPSTSKQVVPTSQLYNIAVPAATLPDSYATGVNTALNVSAPGVLANDTDPNGLALTSALVRRPTHGLITMRSDGSFVYVPTAGYEGPDWFTYKASNGYVNSAETRVDLMVDRPVYVSAVMVNDTVGRSVSAINPGAGGVQSVKVTFSKPVTFAPTDVVVQTVAFSGTCEQVTATLVLETPSGWGTDQMTITLPSASAVDTWVKVTLKGNGTLRSSQGGQLRLDGEPKSGGSGRTYIYSAADMPTGNGTEGGDAVFYVGSLRGDFAAAGGAEVPDGRVTQDDVAGFTAKFQAADMEADYRGVGFGAALPDGRVTPSDIDAFMAVYQAAVVAGRHLDALPNPGPQAGGQPAPLAGSGPEPLGPAMDVSSMPAVFDAECPAPTVLSSGGALVLEANETLSDAAPAAMLLADGSGAGLTVESEVAGGVPLASAAPARAALPATDPTLTPDELWWVCWGPGALGLPLSA